MKEVKELFSKINNVKLFLSKLRNMLKLVYNSVNKFCKKLGNKYRKANLKNKYIEPIVVIVTSCIFVLAMILTIRSFTTIEEVVITKNLGEILYYENKYDLAIEEYRDMQNDDNWPEWTIKIADIYSLKGETDKSNLLLKEAIAKRDKIIKEHGYDKFEEKDIDLINSMLTIFTLNGEYEEAISIAEEYIDEYGENKDILKTMFTAYIMNGDSYKANKLVEKYPVDDKSAYDISILANMKMILGNWNDGIELLKDAWKVDNNELKINYVIESAYLLDKGSLITELQSKIKNSKDEEYKVFLANIYCMDKYNANKAIELISNLDKDTDSIIVDYVKYKASIAKNNIDEAINYIDEAIYKAKNISSESYTVNYLYSLKAIISDNYDEALSYAKKSINSNNKYSEAYGILIPEILLNKKEYTSIEVYYREAIKREPFNYKFIINLADYYSEYIFNNENAKKYYEIAMKFNESNESVYSKIIDIYMKENKIDSAIKGLEEIVKINEENYVYYRTLGALYLEKGMYDKGIEFTRKAYSMNEGDLIALNNAAWYYLNVEKDIERGYSNIKSAYDDITAGLDEDVKANIIENYNSVKRLYEEFQNNNSKEFDEIGIDLIY